MMKESLKTSVTSVMGSRTQLEMLHRSTTDLYLTLNTLDLFL
jgi:hypothetical protein